MKKETVQSIFVLKRKLKKTCFIFKDFTIQNRVKRVQRVKHGFEKNNKNCIKNFLNPLKLYISENRIRFFTRI